MSRIRSGAAALAGTLLLVSLSAAPADANHSVPVPKWFWDGNDNGSPSGEPEIDAEGSGWSNAMLNRLDEAVAEWSGDTAYDPTVGTSGHNVWVDGTVPRCEDDWRTDSGGIIGAKTCRTAEPRYDGEDLLYMRMIDSDTYFNIGAPDNIAWDLGAGFPPANTVHFLGVLTHELGHSLRLLDIPKSTCENRINGSDWYTMCGTYELPVESTTYWAHSLHGDDITGANYVY